MTTSESTNPSGRFLTGLIALAFAGIVAVLIYGLMSNLLISRDLKQVLDETNKYDRPSQNPPSEARAAYLAASASQLEAYLNEFRNGLFMKDSLAGRRTGDALAFKEALYGIERRLHDAAEARDVHFPERFGFQSDLAALPESHELSDLFYELDLFEAVGNALLEAGGITINTFTFEPPQTTTPSDAPAQTVFYAELELETGFSGWIHFLDALRRLPHLLSVARVEIKPAKTRPDQISVALRLKAVML